MARKITTTIIEWEDSSYVKKTAYNDRAEELVVVLNNGKVFQYNGVSPDMHNCLENSGSIGAFIQKVIVPSIKAIDITPKPASNE